MAADYRHTQIPHCDGNSNNNSTAAAELSLSTYNGPISGLQPVHKAVLFRPHAKGRVSCVTLPHQEVLLDVSPYTDLLPEFDVHRKDVRNFRLTATNSSIVSSWSSNVTQTTAFLILQFNVEKISSPLNIKVNPNYI
jgi:hypothetical protein